MSSANGLLRPDSFEAASCGPETLDHQAEGEDLRPVLRALPLGAVRQVLEIGSGTGTLACALAGELDGRGEVLSIDVSEAQVREAAARAAAIPNVRFLRGDVLDAPSLADHTEACDLVVCRYLLMYLIPRGLADLALATMIQCTRAGGTVACIEADVDFGHDRYPPPPEPLASTLPNLVTYYRAAGRIEWRAGLRLFELMTAAGLQDVAVAVADGRVIQGGRPSALAAHGADNAAELLGPVLDAMGIGARADEVERQWRAYLADPRSFLYTPVFVGTGRKGAGHAHEQPSG